VITTLTIAAWLALEISLFIRDRVRGKGGTATDRGTLLLNLLVLFVATTAASAAHALLAGDAAWQFGSTATAAAGVLVMWAGLALRIWAIRVLGGSFRMTVEVDGGQPVVDHGPYRYVRHPSYSGLLLIVIGLALIYGNWLSLAILAILPAAVLLRRISVEESVLAGVLGQPYADYKSRTKRLVPGLW
jgi:protein-S-isoprenylcysteine O-methyltransferase Ste14